MTAQPDRIAALLAPVVASAGLDLEGVEVTPAGRRRVVRVLVDTDGGVGLDDVASVSRSVSDALDGAGLLGDSPYVLEVSSPGVDRPLTEARHWRRAVGRLVVAELTGGEGVTGRVEAADAEGVDLDVAGHDRRISYDRVVRAQVQVEFSRPGGVDEPGEE